MVIVWQYLVMWQQLVLMASGDFGSVYIFTYQSGNWTQTDKIIPVDGEINDWFGHSSDLDGNYLLVGNPYDDDDGTNIRFCLCLSL